MPHTTYRLIEKLLSKDKKLAMHQRRQSTLYLMESFISLIKGENITNSVEIGAHEGNFSTLMKRHRPEMNVLAYEANPVVFEQYASTLKKAGVEYKNLCVGPKQGQQSFRVPIRDGKPNSFMGSILKDTWSEDHVTYDVPMISMDQIAKENPGRTAIWLDVEGALGPVLSGAKKSLESCIMLYAEVEIKQRWDGQMIDDEFYNEISSFGLVPWLPDVQRNFQYNILCIRPEAISHENKSRVENSYFTRLADVLIANQSV